MTKKHYLCTHTWVSPEAREGGLKATSQMTDTELFAALKTEKAEMLQHWMGKEDFFYCHWYAEDEDAIFAALENVGYNDIMASLPSEMQRYVTAENLTYERLVNPEDK